ncbi:succinate dehydrogenase assembly factor 4, mitochondrial-like [Teleopsis dalmanni]|uniref:succinate dehydrogenase assembly factor 4, mitochondrial-like n=1 Tax=Teleopsis dalmanni TaxID=139649 RepID=UPI0018CEC23F|nr:succinate dehydrogenase assembly factor 4, mitochondrial-like [Teleopsis dalmanni]
MDALVNLIKQKKILTLGKSAHQVKCFMCTSNNANPDSASKGEGKTPSKRVLEFQKKLRAENPDDETDQLSLQSFMEQDIIKPWPNNTNPHTGEVGGPSGPEPTRYGDWERKGRVTDF